MNSLDSGTNNDNNQLLGSPEPTQVQVDTLGPLFLWTKMIKFEFLLLLCGHCACWSKITVGC